MSAELDRLLERARQTIAAQRAEIAQRLRASRSGAGAGARPLDAGARVFDRVSGEEGIVVGRTRENVIVPTPERGDR